MKKQTFIIAVACSILFLIACNKSDYLENPFQKEKNKQKPFLKEIIHATRNYSFHYDHMGYIDSISVIDLHLTYVYRVAHHGKRIDSVSLVEDAAIVSTNGNIKYDNMGRITQFTYYPRYDPLVSVNVITLTYDYNGQIKKIAYSSNGSTHYDTLTFDNHSNLIRWAQPQNLSTFTYATGLNPLYYIDDLYVMFTEEKSFWQYLFSQHNSITKYLQDGVNYETTSYQNLYDGHHRLIKKTINTVIAPGIIQQPDSLEFRYLY
ncbi:hypothetical protein [Chitinophaga sp. CF118]|uniref:hypothetical protein n=1 Tax=Chitinophaga sp. CF118 TaxID=1884367 RepID=UPI0011607259|nr:hypothetical protein [Chitinophaga sp. CF118]